MNPQFDEVLLTAYLDNEVTDEERASVEKQLQSSEASRKLLEELRSVRNLVSQLHLSQPARRFQQGPWNEPALLEVNDVTLSVGTPWVVLKETRWYQRIPLQRLASLAALFAIAVCASAFLMGPNTKSVIRLSETGRTKTASDATVAPSRSLAEQSKTDDFRFQKNEELDSASPIDRKSKLSEGLAFDPPPAPNSATADLPPVMSNIGKAAESKSGIDGLADDVQPIVENFVKLRSSGMPRSTEFKKEIFFRYRDKPIDQQSGIAFAEKAMDNPIKESLGKNSSLGAEEQRVEAAEGIEKGAMLVEFQIPIENWELGAQQLRKLGMDLPGKLPEVEYLEFTAIPIAGPKSDFFSNAEAAELPIDRFVVDVNAAKEVLLTQWEFLAMAPQEKETPTKIETPAKKLASKDKKQNLPSSSTLRIRVRPIR